MELRDYQERVISDVFTELENYQRPFVVNAFQSSGKSIMIAELVRRVDEPVLILCMSKELVEQDAAKLRAVGVEPTIYSASCGEKIMSDITVATIGSIYKKPNYCQHFGLVIIDECDAVPVETSSSMYMKLLNKLSVKIVGWTGTPFRTKQMFSRAKNGDTIQKTMIKPLSEFKFWGKILDGVEWQELSDGGFVAKHKYYVDDVDKSMLRVNSTGNDFTEASLMSYAEKTRHRVIANVKGAIREWGSRKILATVPNIDEAETITDMLIDEGIKAKVLHSQMKKRERDAIIKSFKEGDTRVVVQVLILNVGFDMPELDCIIFARPSMSLRIWCQTVARGIRKFEGKECKIIDMGGELERFGRIESVKVQHGVYDKIVCDHGVISDKIINRINISEMKRRFHR